MSHRTGGLLAIAMALSAAGISGAQDVAVLPEVRVTSRAYVPHQHLFVAQTNLIEARVVVRDRNGNAMTALPESDFQLLVDGRPVPFTGFATEVATVPGAAVAAGPGLAGIHVPTKAGAAPPRYVALFLDDLSLDRVAVMQARNAARKLREQDLAGNIRLGIFTSSGAVGLDFTADSDAWEAALDKVQYRALMPRDGIVSGTRFSPEMAYLVQKSHSPNSPYMRLAEARMLQAGLCVTQPSCQQAAIFEADATVAAAEASTGNILQALQRTISALAARSGDRVLLLTSTGFFADSLMPDVQQVAEQALRDHVVIDSLDAKLLETLPPRATALEQSEDLSERDGLNAPLATLAADTGGTFFQNNNDLPGALRRDVSQPEVTYDLSFTPTRLPYDGKFHTIKVLVKGVRGGAVQTRKGYFDPAPDDDLFRAGSPDAVDAAVLGPTHSGKLPGEIATHWAGGLLHVEVVLDPARLHLHWCRENRRCDSLVFTSAVFDAQGKFIVGKTGAMGLDLTSNGFKKMEKTGLGAGLSLHVPPGRYRLREVIEEGNSGLVAVDDMIQVGG